MNEMMRACWDWMMELGWMGMLLSVVALAMSIALTVVLFQQIADRSPQG